jgi:serine/threonine-protein kinase
MLRVDLEGQRTPKAVTKGSAGRIDPNERWVAVYQPANDEIYVVPFADPSGARSRISTDGGRNPLWSADGKTLFYRRGQAIVAVAVNGDDPSVWKQQTLFEGSYLFDIGPVHFDVARDGRFLMVKTNADGNEGPTQIVVVQNWFEELRRLAPLK